MLIARPTFLFGDSSSVNSESDEIIPNATAADRIRAVG